VQVHDTAARVSAGAENRMLAKKRGQILNLSADRSSSRSASIYDSPSTAHLTGLQAPTVLGVHASLDHVATAVVSV